MRMVSATLTLVLGLIAAQPAKSESDLGLAVLGGVLGGIIINESMESRVYVQPQPYYEPYAPRFYYPPPVYYRPEHVCNFQSWYDQWGNIHTQRVCY